MMWKKDVVAFVAHLQFGAFESHRPSVLLEVMEKTCLQTDVYFLLLDLNLGCDACSASAYTIKEAWKLYSIQMCELCGSSAITITFSFGVLNTDHTSMSKT